VRRVELQFQEPLKEAAGMGVRPRVIEIVELAGAPQRLTSELPAATLRAGAGRVGVRPLCVPGRTCPQVTSLAWGSRSGPSTPPSHSSAA
jgi:hypothetical protein